MPHATTRRSLLAVPLAVLPLAALAQPSAPGSSTGPAAPVGTEATRIPRTGRGTPGLVAAETVARLPGRPTALVAFDDGTILVAEEGGTIHRLAPGRGPNAEWLYVASAAPDGGRIVRLRA